MFHVLAHGTDVVVFLGVVVQILHQECVFPVFTLVLRVEHVVFDERLDPVLLHPCIVLLAPVAGVRDGFRALDAVALAEGGHEGDEGALVGRPPVDPVVRDVLIFRGDLDVVAGFGLAVVHRVLLYPHECRVRVRLRVAVALAQDLQLLLIFTHLPDGLLRQLLHGFPVLLVRGPLPVGLLRFHLFQNTFRPLLHLLCCQGLFQLGLPLFHLQRPLRLFQYRPDVLFKFCLVGLGRPFPYERVLVGHGLYLGPVDVLHVQRYEALIDQQLHHLREQALERPHEALAPEVVDGAEVRDLRASQPHVDDALPPRFLYLAARVDIAQVRVDDDFQQCPGCIGTRPAALVRSFELTDIQVLNDGIDHPGGMLGRDHVGKIYGKEAPFVAIVRFINYLCHA